MSAILKAAAVGGVAGGLADVLDVRAEVVDVAANVPLRFIGTLEVL